MTDLYQEVYEAVCPSCDGKLTLDYSHEEQLLELYCPSCGWADDNRTHMRDEPKRQASLEKRKQGYIEQARKNMEPIVNNSRYKVTP